MESEVLGDEIEGVTSRGRAAEVVHELGDEESESEQEVECAVDVESQEVQAAAQTEMAAVTGAAGAARDEAKKEDNMEATAEVEVEVAQGDDESEDEEELVIPPRPTPPLPKTPSENHQELQEASRRSLRAMLANAPSGPPGAPSSDQDASAPTETIVSVNLHAPSLGHSTRSLSDVLANDHESVAVWTEALRLLKHKPEQKDGPVPGYEEWLVRARRTVHIGACYPLCRSRTTSLPSPLRAPPAQSSCC
jgi:hypothetical protein